VVDPGWCSRSDANLLDANLLDANLEGASLIGVTYGNTTMPDGSTRHK
jgi:uncharacterized protein YjbI with pentapeptide repeats